MAGFRIEGNTSGNVVEVSSDNFLKVITETDATANPNNVGSTRQFSENDAGLITGTPFLLAPEIDVDYRQRSASDTMFDEENFNYTAQNTGKYFSAATTMAPAWTAGNYQTNSTNITTTTTGVSFGSYAFFPLVGTATLAFDIEAGFSAQPTTNTIIDFGGFIRGAANPYTPVDGCYFRLTSGGLQGIANYNGTEVSTGIFPTSFTNSTPWTYTNAKKYQFIVYITTREAQFWINDNGSINLMGRLQVPTGNGQPMMASSVPFSVRHAITGGAAGAGISFLLSRYSVRVGGPALMTTISTQGNRTLGAYQGLSGGTMGTLANYANSANPTAAVPTNTTAALGTGLGGQFWETATLALNTDGVISSYQVPAGTVNVQGRRLIIRGIGLTSYVQTVIVGGPWVAQYSLAFGHTNVSLATTEAAGAKAPRRIALSAFTQVVTAAQAVSTIVSQPGGSYMDFGDAPIIVNPGEFVQLVAKHVGTVGTSGTIAHIVTFVYGWE
jgi:hypothetical protein